MSALYSENKTHRDAVVAAEGARQVAVAAASTQSAVRSAELVYARAGLKSALANSCDTASWVWLLQSLAGVQA
jgi:hypothetical protein